MNTYARLTIEEIDDRFSKARADPSMRSVTAILRITREQVGARDFLGHYPVAAAGSAVMAVAIIIGAFVLAPEYRHKAMPIAFGSLVVSAMLIYGAVSSSADRKAAAEQERAMRRMAAESLDEILAAPFSRRPLEWEHLSTLRELAKAFPERTRLAELLRS